MNKIGRNYKLIYISNYKIPGIPDLNPKEKESTVIVEPPFSIDFNITRNNFSSSNLGSVRIFNLSKDRRNLMRKDWQNFTVNDRLILKAGYGDNLIEILNMTVSKAFSIREGVDFITQIDCIDGGFAYLNARNEETQPSGTQIIKVIEDNVKKLGQYGVGRGVISDFQGTIKRGNSSVGNPMNAITNVTGGAGFIDNSKINILKKGEAIAGSVLKVNAGTGLLNTPIRQDVYVEFELIFEPQISIGRLIELESSTGDVDSSGQYAVTYLSHRGMISESVGGSVTTTVGCLSGSFNQVRTN